jgi:hypothetical protein
MDETKTSSFRTWLRRRRERPETPSRRFRAARRGFLLGALIVGLWALWDRHLVLSYEVVVVSDGTPESERVWFWLDGEAFVGYRIFDVNAGDRRQVRLTFPVRRASRDPALLEYGPSTHEWNDPDPPPPPGAQRIRVEGGGQRLRCTIVAEVTRGETKFATAQGDRGPCVRAYTVLSSD